MRFSEICMSERRATDAAFPSLQILKSPFGRHEIRRGACEAETCLGFEGKIRKTQGVHLHVLYVSACLFDMIFGWQSAPEGRGIQLYPQSNMSRARRHTHCHDLNGSK